MRIDARGLRCPWPAIRLARALREGTERLEIVADDPAAPGELAAVAAAAGVDITLIKKDSASHFRVERRGGVNNSFTPLG